MKKVLALILVLAMVIGLVACGNSNAPAASEPPKSDSEETKAPEVVVDDPVEEDNSLVFYDWEYEIMTGEEEILKQINEKYNLNISFKAWPSSDELQQQYVMDITSGNIPDIMASFNDTTFEYYNQFVEQGVLAEIPVEDIKTYAPDYYNWVVKNGGENIWKAFERNGKNYSLPCYWTLGSSMYVIGYRGDMFAEAGYDELPATIEGVEEALKAVRDKYDIYPLTAAGSNKKLDGLSFVYGAFGSCPTVFHENENGEIVFGGITEEARQAVEVLHRWYEEDLIDLEFSVNKTENMVEKWTNGSAAMLVDSWWEFTPEDTFFSATYYNALSSNEQAQTSVKTSAAPVGSTGLSGFQQRNPAFDSGILLGKQLEGTETLKNLLRLINDMDFTEEGLAFCNYGEEGVTHEIGENGEVIWLEPYTTEEARAEYGCDGRFHVFFDPLNDYDLQARYMTAPERLELRQETEAKATGKYDALVLTYRPVYNQYAEVLDQINLAAHIDFITGARDLSEWDDFVNEWLESGGTETLAEAEANWEAIS